MSAHHAGPGVVDELISRYARRYARMLRVGEGGHSPLRLELARAADTIYARIGLRGELDVAAMAALLAHCRWVLYRNVSPIIIDLTALAGADGVALRALARLARVVARHGGQLALVAAGAAARDWSRGPALPPALPLYADERRALAACTAARAAARESPAAPYLIMPNGQQWPLADDVLTIGQHIGNRLRIADSRLSSLHAAIVREGGTYLLFDCNSAGGTFVNGRHARDVHILRDGDQIEVADWVLHFRAAAPARRVLAPAAPGPRPRTGAPGAVGARAGRASFGEWRLDELRALRDRAVSASRALEAVADRPVVQDEGAEAPAPVAFVFADLTGRRWIRLRLLAAVLGAWSLTLAIVFVHFLLR